jgi:hypothetical protein
MGVCGQREETTRAWWSFPTARSRLLIVYRLYLRSRLRTGQLVVLHWLDVLRRLPP